MGYSPWGLTESDMTERLSRHARTCLQACTEKAQSQVTTWVTNASNSVRKDSQTSPHYMCA